jgi:hypothetical protein
MAAEDPGAGPCNCRAYFPAEFKSFALQFLPEFFSLLSLGLALAQLE